MKRKIMIPALVIAALVSTAGGLAFAKQTGGMENDAVADLAQTKISLTQAVGTAETQAGGRATKAELESERGAVVYKVEVVAADNTVFDVKVSAADGSVLGSTQDRGDRGDRGDKEEQDD